MKTLNFTTFRENLKNPNKFTQKLKSGNSEFSGNIQKINKLTKKVSACSNSIRHWIATATKSQKRVNSCRLGLGLALANSVSRSGGFPPKWRFFTRRRREKKWVAEFRQTPKKWRFFAIFQKNWKKRTKFRNSSNRSKKKWMFLPIFIKSSKIPVIFLSFSLHYCLKLMGMTISVTFSLRVFDSLSN